MPKQTNILANQRLDIPDFKAQTVEFTEGLSQLNVSKFLLDKMATIAEGFRVEVADQTVSPGTITVVNGVAFDRSGRVIFSESEENASRSLTMTVNATYYIEAVVETTPSDVDSRAFWDQTYDNGTDPSGDARPDGREFAQNVATRITSDWSLVNPPSTTGFQWVLNKNSVRIPICVVVVSGGVITGTSAVLRSVLDHDLAISDTSIPLLNTRAMPDAGWTLRLNPGGANQEDVTVTANDRTNSILTIGGGTANAHIAGERVTVAGVSPPQYLLQRTTPFDVALATTGDARPRMWSGDEDRGHRLGLDPEGSLAIERSDVQVETLKRHVDFLAAQIREMKFGAASTDALGALAPPTSFNNPVRYFDAVGGLAGARSHTITIADGTNYFGDFNVNAFADARACFQAAFDAIPGGANGGGTVCIRPGTYTFTGASVDLTGIYNKQFSIIAEGAYGSHLSFAPVILETTGANPAVEFGDMSVHMENIAWRTSGTSEYAVNFGATQVTARQCEFQGATSASMSDCQFDACFFTTTVGNAHGIFLDGSNNITFSNCVFEYGTIPGTGNCVRIEGSTAITIDNCWVALSFSAASTAAIFAQESDLVIVRSSRFVTPASKYGVQFSTILTCAQPRIENCNFEFAESGIGAGTIADAVISGNYFKTAGGGEKCITAQSIWRRVRIDNNHFEGLGSTDTSIDMGTFDNTDVAITNNYFEDFGIGIGGRFDAFSMVGNTFNGVDKVLHANSTQAYEDVRIENNKIRDCFDATATSVIDFSGATGGLYRCHIKGNTFEDIGDTSAGTVRAIDLSGSGAVVNFAITDNVFHNFSADISGFDSIDCVIVSDGFYGAISDNVFTGIGNVATEGSNLPSCLSTQNSQYVTITGNSISDWANSTDTQVPVGIAVYKTAPGVGPHTITGNQVSGGDDFSTGIFVSNNFNCTIAGNSVRMPGVNQFGIQCTAALVTAVTGNSVVLTESDASSIGIDVSGTELYTIVGNVVEITNGAGACVSLNGGTITTDVGATKPGFVIGNFLLSDTTGTTASPATGGQRQGQDINTDDPTSVTTSLGLLDMNWRAKR